MADDEPIEEMLEIIETNEARDPDFYDEPRAESTRLTDHAREGIFLALADTLEERGWIPSPNSWQAAQGGDGRLGIWPLLTPEQKLSTWIVAPDEDYVYLAELLLNRPLKEMDEQRREDARPPERNELDLAFAAHEEWRERRRQRDRFR